MKLKCETYVAYCELKVFDINGIEARYEDFGYKEDIDSHDAEPYCCGNMKFIPHIRPENGILEKYQITYEDWFDICDELENKLSFGRCCWCS